jgi:stage V sporulation protein AA
VASFNNDVDVSLLFDQILKTTKNTSDLLPWLQISYSVGIPTGILVFYNHISRKKMYNDPTPLEVEMRLYEQEENTAVILNQHRKEEHHVSK